LRYSVCLESVLSYPNKWETFSLSLAMHISKRNSMTLREISVLMKLANSSYSQSSIHTEQKLFLVYMPNILPVYINYTTSSSSCSNQGVGPLVDSFQSHASRSLFNGLPWSLLLFGV
jgi:hypothetical protein